MTSDVTDIIFDLDGTLIDSSKGIFSAFSLAASLFDLPTPTFRHFSSLIGPPIRDIIRLIYPKLDLSISEKFVSNFRHFYDSQCYSSFSIYPNVQSSLHKFVDSGFRIYVVTNKPTAPACTILSSLNLINLFGAVIGIDYPCSLSRPPFSSKSEALSFLLAKYSLINSSCLYVGDTFKDYESCKSLCLPFIGASYGFYDWSSLDNISVPLISDIYQLQAYLTTN